MSEDLQISLKDLFYILNNQLNAHENLCYGRGGEVNYHRGAAYALRALRDEILNPRTN